MPRGRSRRLTIAGDVPASEAPFSHLHTEAHPQYLCSLATLVSSLYMPAGQWEEPREGKRCCGSRALITTPQFPSASSRPNVAQRDRIASEKTRFAIPLGFPRRLVYRTDTDGYSLKVADAPLLLRSRRDPRCRRCGNTTRENKIG